MFQSSLDEAQAFLNNYIPKAGEYYTTKRNYSYDDDNNSTTTSLISPYIRYRLISEEDVIKKTLKTHPYKKVEKFIQEIYWRTYWKGWLEHRPDVYNDYLEQRDNVFEKFYNKKNYLRAVEGDTELNFFNNWVLELKENGYLHNHVRMWFASIWIFTLNLPWQLGANLFMENLLDGDPASNTLSWRWVAGLQTKGKHYLARKKNIIKFSNIDIDHNIELNENASSLFEEKYYEIKNLNINNYSNNKYIDSIVIPSDELNFIHNQKSTYRNIFSGIPLIEYNDHQYSKKVLNHLKKIMQSNFLDNSSYRNLNYEIHFENYYKSFKNWIIKNQIENVGLPYVTKGNWNHIYKKLISQNPNINFVYLYRDYDIKSWKYSKKGFFNFKKHIPELITKL